MARVQVGDEAEVGEEGGEVQSGIRRKKKEEEESDLGENQ